MMASKWPSRFIVSSPGDASVDCTEVNRETPSGDRVPSRSITPRDVFENMSVGEMKVRLSPKTDGGLFLLALPRGPRERHSLMRFP